MCVPNYKTKRGLRIQKKKENNLSIHLYAYLSAWMASPNIINPRFPFVRLGCSAV